MIDVCRYLRVQRGEDIFFETNKQLENNMSNAMSHIETQQYRNTLLGLITTMWALNTADSGEAAAWLKPEDSRQSKAFGHVYNAIVELAGEAFMGRVIESGEFAGGEPDAADLEGEIWSYANRK
jgi:hypothetical protein